MKDLELALEREKQDRADADERAKRANDRANEADEAYRKLQLALVAAKDEASAAADANKRMGEQLRALEADVKTLREVASASAESLPSARKSAPPPSGKKSVPSPSVKISNVEVNPNVSAELGQALDRIRALRELLAEASVELSQLHADEVHLAEKRERVLTDACALLQRAVGVTGQAPPPIPSPALEARLSMSPVVDISDVADLIESLRPPRAPKVDE